MLISYGAVLVAGIMPVVCAGIAKSGLKGYDNSDPRAWLARQTGFRARANAAQANCFEAFPFFAVGVVLALLTGVDPATVDAKSVIDGMQLVEKKLFKSLAGHGFEIVDPTGHAFDPALHEAVTTAPAAQPEDDGRVAVCFQVGYVINGHVLRPARVVVTQWNGA